MLDDEYERLPDLRWFSQRLNFALERAEMNQSELARELGVTPQAVQKMSKQDRDEYSTERVFQVAEVLQISPDWLMAGKRERVLRVYGRAAKATTQTPPPRLTALQMGVLETLETLMRQGYVDDAAAIDLLTSLRPHLGKKPDPQ